MAMAIHLSSLISPSSPLISSSKPPSHLRSLNPISAVPISNAQTRERQRIKDLFKEARERCINDPMDGVSFTLEEFHTALDENAVGTDVGSKVKGTVFMTNADGAFVDIAGKSSAFLPLNEACIYKIKHVSEAGIYPGLQEEFVVIGENSTDDSLILSLRLVQSDLAWERCQQLQAENAVVKGKVTGGNKGGVLVTVEGIHGFVPSSDISKITVEGIHGFVPSSDISKITVEGIHGFVPSSDISKITVEGIHGFVPSSDISKKSAAEELLGKELPLKFLNVDKKQSQLILSNRKAMVDNRVNIEIGSVVKGTVCSLKPYGALMDIGGLSGLLHVSEISHEHITDIATVLQRGDTLKVMVLSHDQERERLSLSTKKLEPTPGAMIHNPKLVFEKADEIAEDFIRRIAWVEEMACTELLMSQPEV